MIWLLWILGIYLLGGVISMALYAFVWHRFTKDIPFAPKSLVRMFFGSWLAVIATIMVIDILYKVEAKDKWQR